jgi:hypothetical protein
MAARLPDGSDAVTSVSGILPARSMAVSKEGAPK